MGLRGLGGPATVLPQQIYEVTNVTYAAVTTTIRLQFDGRSTEVIKVTVT